MKSNDISPAKAPVAHAPGQKFQLLLFRLGKEGHSSQSELFGINVFKVREIVVAPPITAIVQAPKFSVGLANIRGQLIPVIDLPAVAGCTPQSDAKIVLVTEFARNTQGFLVDEVVEIVQMDWKHLLASEASGSSIVNGIARIDGDSPDSRTAQVLDVEQILRNVWPGSVPPTDPGQSGTALNIPPGSLVMAVDDSAVARMMIEESLKAMHVPYAVAKNGKDAWERLVAIHSAAVAQGKKAKDQVALVLTDLEMPEMDGFTLTQNIKQDGRFAGIPVVVYSSLTGSASESHASSVGADAYVAKFEPKELKESIRLALSKFAE